MIPEASAQQILRESGRALPHTVLPDRDWGASPGHVSPGLRPVSKAPGFKNSPLAQGYLL